MATTRELYDLWQRHQAKFDELNQKGMNTELTVITMDALGTEIADDLSNAPKSDIEEFELKDVLWDFNKERYLQFFGVSKEITGNAHVALTKLMECLDLSVDYQDRIFDLSENLVERILKDFGFSLNTCGSCGKEFKTTLVKRTICPNCFEG